MRAAPLAPAEADGTLHGKSDASVRRPSASSHVAVIGSASAKYWKRIAPCSSRFGFGASDRGPAELTTPDHQGLDDLDSDA